MKLILQIATGVFLGYLAANLVLDKWHDHKQALVQAAAEKIRLKREQDRQLKANQIRELILQHHHGNNPTSPKLPPDFVPDDANSLQVE